MIRHVLGLGLILLLMTCSAVRAQIVTFDGPPPRAQQTLALSYTLLDFTYDGETVPIYTVAFGEPAYGLRYTRPRLEVGLAYGTQAAGEQPGDVVVADTVDLRLLEASLMTWGELFVAPDATGETRVTIPIVLFSHYRRVKPRGSEDGLFDAFNVTALGLGMGLGVDRPVGGGFVEARAWPGIGFASNAFGDALGSAWVVDAAVDLHTPPFAGRFGLSAGYAFRLQRWNVDASELLEAVTEELFDYRGRRHRFYVGVNW